jgi:hypothetical protein
MRPARPIPVAEPDSPELQAFRASLKDIRPGEDAEFAQWRRAQRPQRLLVFLVSLVFLAPGAVCFVLQAPWWVSLGLELAGFAANDWRRRERKRLAQAITDWTPSSGGGL